MGINAEIRTFQMGLVAHINESPLPIELKRLVLQDVIRQVNQVAESQIQAEIKADKEQEVAPVQQEEKPDDHAKD